MDNQQETKVEKAIPKEHPIWAWYIVAGSVVAFYHGRYQGLATMVAIVAGLFYRPVKRRIGIQNGAIRIIVTYFLLLFGSSLVIGFLSGILERFSA